MGSMEYPMYIGGQWVQTGERRTVRLPYDGSPVAEYFVAGPEQVEAAVRAARAAAPVMREMTLAERARILRKAAQRLEERHEEVAMAISSESGKPLREARVEVDRGIQTLSFSAEEAHRLAGEVVPMEAAPAGKGHWAITVREPLGVIAASRLSTSRSIFPCTRSDRRWRQGTPWCTSRRRLRRSAPC